MYLPQIHRLKKLKRNCTNYSKSLCDFIESEKYNFNQKNL
ncbi:MAG: hypothetical protein JWP12_3032 [Bacteroidetes bacterium]|nr:hypothetical protein [Bacteroidota bacterium]